MGGFLQRLQRRKSGGKSPQAEDIIRRKDSAAGPQAAAKKKAHTAILLTQREPSRDGLLAELTGFSKSLDNGDARFAVDSTRALSSSADGDVPPWLNVSMRVSPALDRLVPTARLVLHELFSESAGSVDTAGLIKRAVSAAVHRLSDTIQFTSRDIHEAVQELSGLILGKGPLKPLYEDPLVTDIFVDAYDKIRCVRLGHALETPFRFRGPKEYEAFFSGLLRSAGRSLSKSCPIVDCVLTDEWRSRINAIHGSLRENSEPALVIRVPRIQHPTLYDLLRSQTMPAPVAAWLSELVAFGENNILVMGPAGSGKTTLTAALLSAVGSDERVCTIEELPEIFVTTCHLEKLISRPADSSGDGQIGMDILLEAALRRAPHRIVFGELKEQEGRFFLEALEAGFSGSIATMRADNLPDGMWRYVDGISTAHVASLEVSQRRISRSINLVIMMRRIDGRPCVVDISEVLPCEGGHFQLQPLVQYDGQVKGKRRWRRVVERSALFDSMSEKGVEMLQSPALLSPPQAPSRPEEVDQR